jgi:hypothetical protein
VKKQLGNQYTEKDIFAAIKDIDYFTLNAFNLSDTGNPLLAAVFKTMQEANHKGRVEFDENMSEFNTLLEKARPSMKALSKDGND